MASTSSPRPPVPAAPTTDFRVADVSLTTSIGPPGSDSEIAMPATNGARLSRAHSSSVKSALPVIWHRVCHGGELSRRSPWPRASSGRRTDRVGELFLGHAGAALDVELL